MCSSQQPPPGQGIPDPRVGVHTNGGLKKLDEPKAEVHWEALGEPGEYMRYAHTQLPGARPPGESHQKKVSGTDKRTVTLGESASGIG